ncbi:VOC family protein [Mesorhizobium sp.]|uniref:VOC family protein n=1 Tax=Mesorhizobium sp. TaxID=1871066 RepID=UPI0025D351CC|nr:VOC family protein [Mesorhizobium sp.]
MTQTLCPAAEQATSSCCRRTCRFATALAVIISIGFVPGAFAQTIPAETGFSFPPPPTADQRFRLHHVTIFVHDSEAVADWYVRHLGFEIIDRAKFARQGGGEFDSIRVGTPGLWINISRLPNLVLRDPAKAYAGWRQISLAVANLPAAMRQLRAEGVDVVGDDTLHSKSRERGATHIASAQDIFAILRAT